MVVCAVEKFGKLRPVCFARPLLFKASESLERGDIAGCGCLLREAVRRFVVALCDAHDVEPRKGNTTLDFCKALKKAKQLDSGGYKWLRDTLKFSHRAAHCHYVKPSLLQFGIGIMFTFLDFATEIDQPLRGQGGAV